MNDINGLQELRQNLGEDEIALAEEGRWETIIDFTRIKKDGVSVSELLLIIMSI